MLFTWVQLFSPKTYLLPNYQYLNHLFAQKKCGTSVISIGDYPSLCQSENRVRRGDSLINSFTGVR